LHPALTITYAVPEPDGLLLIALGAVALFLLPRRTQRIA
jgi:hypothetical protein